MNNKDLISQYVDTGLRIPEHQVTQLPNWAKKTYIRKRLIAANQSSMLSWYEIILLDDESKNNYLSKLEADNIERLLHASKNPDIIIDYYLDNDLLFSRNSTNRPFSIFRQYYTDVDKLITIALTKYINQINPNDIGVIVWYSNNPDVVISKLLNNKHTLSIIKPKTMDYMIQKSTNPKELVRLFLSLRPDMPQWEFNNILNYGLIHDYWGSDFKHKNFLTYFKDDITDDMLSMFIIGADDNANMLTYTEKLFGKERIAKLFP